jgi:hypothetical protein
MRLAKVNQLFCSSQGYKNVRWNGRDAARQLDGGVVQDLPCQLKLLTLCARLSVVRSQIMRPQPVNCLRPISTTVSTLYALFIQPFGDQNDPMFQYAKSKTLRTWSYCWLAAETLILGLGNEMVTTASAFTSHKPTRTDCRVHARS